MENNFAKTMTELRHQKGITQKQAALSLGVSQALLSHYEKGVRECGLDFLMRAAAFYGVSCDTLLGISELPPVEQPPAEDPDKLAIINSLEILFDLLEGCQNDPFKKEVSKFLMLAVYRVVRPICDPGDEGGSIFNLPRRTFRATADAAMQIAEADIASAVNGQAVPGIPPLDNPDDLRLTRRELVSAYQDRYKDLLRLVKLAEEKMVF